VFSNGKFSLSLPSCCSYPFSTHLPLSLSLIPVSLTKEEKSYITEAEEQRNRIKEYQDSGKDEWHIKKQKEVLEDSLKMIPDCKKRLEAAVSELEAMVVSITLD